MIGVGIGQMLGLSGFGALLGPPIAGWLIAYRGFVSAQVFAGVMIAFGTCLVVSLIFPSAEILLDVLTASLFPSASRASG